MDESVPIVTIPFGSCLGPHQEKITDVQTIVPLEKTNKIVHAASADQHMYQMCCRPRTRTPPNTPNKLKRVLSKISEEEIAILPIPRLIRR